MMTHWWSWCCYLVRFLSLWSGFCLFETFPVSIPILIVIVYLTSALNQMIILIIGISLFRVKDLVWYWSTNNIFVQLLNRFTKKKMHKYSFKYGFFIQRWPPPGHRYFLFLTFLQKPTYKCWTTQMYFYQFLTMFKWSNEKNQNSDKLL